MPQERHDDAEDENLRQDPKREDLQGRVGPVLQDVGGWLATEKAKHQRSSRRGRRLDRPHQVIHKKQRVTDLWHVQQQERQRELDCEANAHLRIADFAPALAQEPSQA